MIAKLTGILDSLSDDSAIVDVAGVGYLVFCSGRTLGTLPRPGETVSLAIETHVREDHINLYGFTDEIEREWFRLLTTVQGVGARVALALMTAMGANELAQAVLSQDRAALTTAQGVGAKLAARILTELKDRVEAMSVVHRVDFTAAGGGDGGAEAAGAGPDAVSALVNLGYRRSEAFGAVSHAQGLIGHDATLEVLVRAGLKELGA
jgi:Holliday junction DNA helicase RuvA